MADSSDEDEVSIEVPLDTSDYKSPLPSNMGEANIAATAAAHAAAAAAASVPAAVVKARAGITILEADAVRDAIKRQNKHMRGTAKTQRAKSKKVKKVEKAMARVDKMEKHVVKKAQKRTKKKLLREVW